MSALLEETQLRDLPSCELSLHRAAENWALNIGISGCLSREFFVEVLGVQGIGLASISNQYFHQNKVTYHIRLERRLILPLKKLSPIDAMEEGMSLDFRSSVGT